MGSTFGLICLGLIALGLWIGVAGFFIAYLQLRRTLQAVEALSYQLMESAEKLHRASSQLSDFAGHVRSGWMKVFELALGAAQTLWQRPPKAEAASPSTDGHEQ